LGIRMGVGGSATMGNSCCNNAATLHGDHEHNEEDTCSRNNTGELRLPQAAIGNAPVSNEDLVEVILKAQSGMYPDLKGGDGRHAMINVETIEMILLADEPEEEEETKPLRRAQGRKGTGYVSKAEVESAMSSISFSDDAIEAAAGAGQPPAPNRKGRKSTGVVTKEQLLAALNEADGDEDEDDEDGEEAPQLGSKSQVNLEAKTAANTGERLIGDQIAPAPKRKGRKPTGFVSKSKLRKVLDMFGE